MDNYIIINGELYHYGVKGMKWGKRKAPEEGGGDGRRKKRPKLRDRILNRLREMSRPIYDDDDDTVTDDRQSDSDDQEARRESAKKSISDKYGEAGKQQGYADNERRKAEAVRKAYTDEADLLEREAKHDEEFGRGNKSAQLKERASLLRSEADRLGKEYEDAATAYENAAKKARTDADRMSMENRIYLGERDVNRIMNESRKEGSISAKKYDNFTKTHKEQISVGRKLSEELLSGADRDRVKLDKQFDDVRSNLDKEFDDIRKDIDSWNTSDFDW